MKNTFFNRGDIFGGLTAGIVALPLALAFGVQSGLGPAAGIYGAIFLGMLASLFGGTPTQISGPTGPMTVVTASLCVIIAGHTGSLESGYGLILVTFLLAGLFQILFGWLRAGQYIRYIPYPVLSGFMSGIGFIIILLQLYPLLGYSSPQKITDVIRGFPAVLPVLNPAAAMLSLATVATVYLFPLLTRKLPSTLVSLILLSLLSYILKLDVPLIGSIPTGFPRLHLNAFAGISLSDLTLIIFPALTLAGLGALDSLLTSVVADNVTKSRHHSNRELIGQGIGNSVAALFGGIPGAGATMRTLVNIRSGGKGRMSGVIHSLMLLLVMTGLGATVKWIPLPVLAGILVTVGINIIDLKGLKDLRKIPRADAVTLLTVLLFTVFVDLLQAVGIGMIISSILFMKRAGDLVESGTLLTESTLADKEIPWEDEKELYPGTLSKIYIQRLDGPVFFGAVTRFRQVMETVPSTAETVIIRMRKVPYMDQSGLYAFETAVRDLQSRGIRVVLTIVQPQVMYMFERVNLVPGLIPAEYCFRNFEECAAWLNSQYTPAKTG